MQAVLLSAGESSRFYPYNKKHKSLITILGKTLVSRTLNSLRKANITDIIIVEDASKHISKTLGKDEAKGLNIRFLIQEKPTGMGDALLLSSKFIKDSFFLLNSYHFEVNLFYKEMLKAKKKKSDL